jgi:hypothetical protein
LEAVAKEIVPKNETADFWGQASGGGDRPSRFFKQIEECGSLPRSRYACFAVISFEIEQPPQRTVAKRLSHCWQSQKVQTSTAKPLISNE